MKKIYIHDCDWKQRQQPERQHTRPYKPRSSAVFGSITSLKYSFNTAQIVMKCSILLLSSLISL